MAQGPAQPHPLGDPPLSCARCGACCHSPAPGYIRLFAVDLERLPEQATRLVVAGAQGPEMRFVAGRCVALHGEGTDAACGCAIHPHRPDACRWLVPGSGACRDARARRGLEPLTR